ncbi:MAG: carbon-nitrogen hydrolase family protein [Clostridiales bacterium]|nr:carbon-nitrogen hydrolase family protein [Clostridiales bacterium]
MFKIALCQKPGSTIKTTEECKADNIVIAEKMIEEAAAGGAQIIVLPEIWNAPYSNKAFPPFSEPEGGHTWQIMSGWAKKHGVYLVGGSIPEIDGDKYYNTCYVFDREGRQIAKHRKAHLFDINVPGKISFKESDVLTPGTPMPVFDTEYGKMAVAICFDVRFADFIRKAAIDGGAKLIFLPAAFNMTTGPAHWDVTMRVRAMDNQIFFAACAPARNVNASYVSYGNSCVVDPWAEFVAHADETPQVLFADIDFDRIDQIRDQLPIVTGRRPELY